MNWRLILETVILAVAGAALAAVIDNIDPYVECLKANVDGVNCAFNWRLTGASVASGGAAALLGFLRMAPRDPRRMRRRIRPYPLPGPYSAPNTPLAPITRHGDTSSSK